METQSRQNTLAMYAQGMFDIGAREIGKDRYYIGIRALAEACELFRHLKNNPKVDECENYLKVCEVYSGFSDEEFDKLYDEGFTNLNRYIDRKEVDLRSSKKCDEFWESL